jgi:hypothetical protein
VGGQGSGSSAADSRVCRPSLSPRSESPTGLDVVVQPRLRLDHVARLGCGLGRVRGVNAIGIRAQGVRVPMRAHVERWSLLAAVVEELAGVPRAPSGRSATWSGASPRRPT